MTAVVAREDEFLNGLSFQELNVVHVDLDQGNKLLLRCFFLLYYCWKMNDFPFNVSLFFFNSCHCRRQERANLLSVYLRNG